MALETKTKILDGGCAPSPCIPLPQRGEGSLYGACVSSDLHIQLNGEELHLHPSGALWWAAERTLVFADLHFEKGSSFARGGQLLPPYDTRSTLARIAALARHYAPERIIALGDSFHDRDAPNRLDDNERAVLRELVSQHVQERHIRADGVACTAAV